MRIHVFSNLIRIVFNTFSAITIIMTTFYILLSLCINSYFPLNVIFVALIIFIAKLLLEFCIVILNRRGKRGVAFSKSCISYNGKKYPLYNISFKYLTFQLSFLQTDLVLPQLVISIPDDHNIICYINKRQLNALKNEMGYEIKVV